MVILDLIQNVALLVALAVAYRMLATRRQRSPSPLRRISIRFATGLLFAAAGIVGMMTPMHFSPGIIIDGRSIILAVASLFGGPLVALVAALPCAVYRLLLGGDGALVGVAVIVESAALGSLLHLLRARYGWRLRAVHYLAFGLVVHLLMLVFMLWLPGEVGWQVIRRIGPTVILLYPLATMLVCSLFDDYDQKARQEAALQDSERRFRSFIHHSPVLIAECGLDGRYLRVNEALAQRYGVLPEELAGRSFDELLPVATAARFRQRIATVVQDRTALWVEDQLDGASEAARYLTVLFPLFDAEDRVVSVGAVAHDITERLQAEAALRASEERHRTTLASIGDAVISTDGQGRVLTMNPVAEHLTGWSAASAAGRPLSEIFRIVNAHTRQEAENPVAKVLAHGQIVGLANHTVLIARDGSERQIADSAAPIRDDGEAIQGVVLVFRDVTEEYAAAERLRASEADLRQAQRVAHIGSWRFDLRKKTVAASDEARRIYGLGDRELTIPEVQAIPLAEDRPALDEALRSLIEEGRDYQVEFRIRRPADGRIRDIHSVAEYDPEHQVVIGTLQDITERKQMADRLRHMEKMDAIGQLAGGVAHDFNNQLGGVLGYGDMLVKRLEDPNLRRYAEHICAAAHRSADLTRKLLAFSRQGSYQSVAVDLHAVIHEVVDFLSHSLDKRIDIKQILTASAAVTRGDPTQLQNALLNLAINAADSMQDGGELIFETSNTVLDAAFCSDTPYDIVPGGYLQIAVSDTGCGISPADLEHIFEPFFTTKEAGKGTGMGLAAVFGTLKQHRGAIEVHSQPGRGTTFRLYLPTADETASSLQKADEMLSAADAATILVIDDEPMVRDLTGDMLGELGYRVTACEDGEAGLAYFRQHWRQIDLVVLDMMMPRLSGAEVFRAMRAIDPSVRVLLASGYSAGGAAQELLAEGVCAFIQKPYEWSEFSTKVAEVLGSDAPQGGGD